MRKEKETKKRAKKNRKKSDDLTGFVPLFRKIFKEFSRLRSIFPGPVVFFFQDFLVLENVKIKLQDFQGFQDPFEPCLTKCRSWNWSTFHPFLSPFFPGGGGGNKVTKIPNWYSNGIFRLSVSKTKRSAIVSEEWKNEESLGRVATLPKLPAFFAPLRLDRSLTTSTRKPKAVRWWFQILCQHTILIQ